MVLNSIFIYSYDGQTLAFRDYNPGESTIEVSRKFVGKYLSKAIKKNAKLKNSLNSTKISLSLDADGSEASTREDLPVIEIEETGYYAVFIIKEDVVYTAFTKVDTHLLVVIDYLKVLIETLEETIGEDLCHEIPKRPKVNLILDLLIDYSIPVLPNKNFLIMLMQKDSYQKVMDKAIDELRTNEDAFWHPHLEGIVSYSEEWLFDHDEIFTGIIDEKGTVHSWEVMGKLDVESKSTQVHSIQVCLKNSQKIESYSLHKWAKASRKRFAKDGILSFSPGLNKFTVAKYIWSQFQWTLPFELTPNIKLNFDTRTLKVKLVLKNQQVAGFNLKVTDFVVKLSFPIFLKDSTLAVNDEKTESFLFNEKDNTGEWKHSKHSCQSFRSSRICLNNQ